MESTSSLQATPGLSAFIHFYTVLLLQTIIQANWSKKHAKFECSILTLCVRRQAAEDAIVMVDCHLGREDYFGRIMRSCHRVNGGGDA